MSTTETKAPAATFNWPDRVGYWWLKDSYGQALAESFRHNAEEESDSPFAVVTHQGEATHHGPFMARDFDPSAQFLWLGEDFTKADVGAGRIQQEVEIAHRDAGLYASTLARSASALGCEPHMVDHEVRRLLAEVLDEIETAARAACSTVKVERDYKGQVAGSLVTDSGALSTNAEWLRRLAAAGRFRIVGEAGRMVVGYWPENDPQRMGGNTKT